jgi:hypothetical protein
MGVSSSTVLRFGYVAVIAILVFSTIQAYRIQGIVSEKHIGIYRQYVKQDEALSQLRRGIWLEATRAHSGHPIRQTQAGGVLEKAGAGAGVDGVGEGACGLSVYPAGDRAQAKRPL